MESSTTTAALKGALLLVAMWVMLLHPSMAQQPASAPAPAPIAPADCPRYCTSRCTPLCKADSDAAARRCDSTKQDTYASSFDKCAGQCNGNSGYARASSCDIGTCSASACGCPCAQRCCQSSTGLATGAYYWCMKGQSMMFSTCLSSCTNVCNSKCVNGSDAFAP